MYTEGNKEATTTTAVDDENERRPSKLTFSGKVDGEENLVGISKHTLNSMAKREREKERDITTTHNIIKTSPSQQC